MAGEVGWQYAVALVALGCLCGLRSCEVVGLSACDVTWQENGAVVAVNRTKNDQYGFKRTSELEYSEDAVTCQLRWVRQYAVGQRCCEPWAGCTREEHPRLECFHCPRLFQNLLSNGRVDNDEKTRGIKKYRVSLLVRLLYAQLAARGVVPEEDVHLYSSKSLRAGAVTGAAAAGCRAMVTAKHLRCTVGNLPNYDRVLQEERGGVSRALNQMVARDR